jgi:hypothetical protein
MLASSRTAAERNDHAAPWRNWGSLLFLGVGLLLLCGSPGVRAGNVTVKDARTSVVNDVAHVDLDLDLEFNPDVIEALRSGIAVEFVIDIEFHRRRWYWLDNEIARSKHRYRIAFQPLSEQYLLSNVVTGDRLTFPTFDDVVVAFGNLRGLPVADISAFKPNQRYRGAVQVWLDIESLPAPMHPLAYLSRAWRMASDWFEWEFQP